MLPAEMSSEGLDLYIQALASYRLILRRAIKRSENRHGRGALMAFFNASDLSELTSVVNPKFVDRRRLTSFYKDCERQPAGAIRELYEELEASEAIAKFAGYLSRLGHRALASDIFYYLEHRISATRTELMAELIRLKRRKPITAHAAAVAYANG
jgi:hypothetical protein